MNKRKLSLLGELNSDIKDGISEAIDFVGDCYGMPDGKTMSDKRQALMAYGLLYLCFSYQRLDFKGQTECILTG